MKSQIPAFVTTYEGVNYEVVEVEINSDGLGDNMAIDTCRERIVMPIEPIERLINDKM